MPVSSLYELARQRLIKNIDMLTDIGDIPFSFLEPVLRHIQNPQQLQELEENCPQIQGETRDIWKRYIRRDVPDWDQKPHTPRDDKNWSKVYRKLVRDAEKEKLDQENQLKEQMKALQAGREGNKTVIMTTNKSYGRTGGHWSMGSGKDYGRAAPPPKTGKVAMDKLKRGMFDRNQARTRAIQTPQHQLAMKKQMVSSIPERLVRMAQQEAPKTMVLSKQASASAVERRTPKPAASQQNIKHRPAASSAQQTVAPPRTSLPAGHQFSAPKLKPTAHGVGAASAPKRKREPSGMFQPTKQRRM